MENLTDYLWLFVGVFWILMQLMRRARRGEQGKATPPKGPAATPRASRQFSQPQIRQPQQSPEGGKPPPPIVPR